MTAIVTDTLKHSLAQKFLTEVNNALDSNMYYIGIGNPIEYNSSDTPIDPLRKLSEEREARNNLMSIKKVEAASFVIPRYNWTSGTVYTGWNDDVVGYPSNSFYVLTEDQSVYICLQQGKTASGAPTTSIIKPSYTDAGVLQYEAFETSDGYRWKFLYSLSATKAASFLTSSYMPVEQVPFDSAGLDTFQLQQLDIQLRSIPGQILGANKVSGGSGYTSVPNVQVVGNGTGARATATISGGAVVKIEMNNESAAMGTGYDYANFLISGGGGTGAVFRPVITPRLGIAHDPASSLKASGVMLNAKPNGIEGGDFFIDQDFRQITVLKNLTLPDSDEIYTATSGKVTNHVVMQSITAFTNDDIIRDSTGGSAGFVVSVDSDRVYYIQNNKTGFRPFEDLMFIEDSDGSLDGIIDSANKPGDVDPYSGEVLYIENRARVYRSASQTEDIKVVITV
jgi:hypothetical protein